MMGFKRPRRRSDTAERAVRSHVADGFQIANGVEQLLDKYGSNKLREIAIATEIEEPGSWLPSMLRDYLETVRRVSASRPA